jgi:signal transduction histidine kinase
VCALATITSLATWSALSLTDDPLGGFMVVGLLGVLPLVLGARGRTSAVAGLAACMGTVIALPWINPLADFRSQDVLPACGIIVVSWVAGRALGSQQRLMSALAEAMRDLRAEHDLVTRSRMDAERTRVTLELHDTVAHALTEIVLQATAARRVWQIDPVLAREHMRDLHEAVADALDELRPMVIALSLGSSPGPRTLQDLASLAERGTRAGLDVRLRVPPGSVTGGLPVAVSTHAYRIVQEALTNAARYAPGSRVILDARVDADAVTVRVANGRPPASPRTTDVPGSGRGIAGMRQRVANCGGEFSATPTPSGGFAVQARLPTRATT